MTLPKIFLTRKGVIYMRWRGAVARIRKRGPIPENDQPASHILSLVDSSIADHLGRAFGDGYHHAANVAHELAYERLPVDCKAHRVRDLKAKSPPSRFPTPDARLFHWFGHLAFAKGIDRSPSHDPQAAKRMKAYPNSCVLLLIRSWEAGWDEAYDSSFELSLERRSILETPRIIDARHIRPAPSTSKKE